MPAFKKIRWIFGACALFAAVACFAAEKPQFLGITSNVAENRGIMAVNDPQSGKPYIAAFGLDSANGLHRRCFLLLIDAQTGKSEQFFFPDENSGNGEIFHLLRSAEGKIYATVGNLKTSTFLEFDLGQKRWTQQDKIKGMAMSFAQAPDGKIYYGTFPESILYEFDPVSRVNREVGRLDPEEKYPFHLAAGDDGWVYAGIGTASSNIVGVDRKSGEVRNLLPADKRLLASADVKLGTDGKAYGRANVSGNDTAKNPWYLLENGKATVQAADFSPELAKPRNIHFYSRLNDFADGSSIVSISMPERVALIERKDGKRETVTFDYQSGGSANTVIAQGPDGMIYGTTNHPAWWFKYDPATGKFSDLGQLTRSLVTNMVNWKGKIVGAGYPDGGLYIYDPQKEWQPALAGSVPEAKANPRRLARFDDIRRPRVTRLLSDGNTVAVGGFPGYGHNSGGIALYNLQTRTARNWSLKDAFPGQSAFVIRELKDGLLAVGTSVYTPGGGRRISDKATFFLFDPKTLSVVYSTPLDTEEIRALSPMANGNIICFGVNEGGSQAFVFDPAKRELLKSYNLTSYGVPVTGGHSLLEDPQTGDLYAVLSRSICKVNADGSLTVLLRSPEPISTGSVFRDGEIYYTVGARLMKFRVKP